MPSRIAGTGSYLPTQVLTNHELARRVDTSDAWIRARTGIRERRIAAPAESTSDLALHAAKSALHAAQLAPADVDLIIVATTTPDMVFPSTACILQAKLGARGGPAFDVQAVCAGFVYALGVADQMVSSGMAKNALVVGAEIYSRILDWTALRAAGVPAERLLGALAYVAGWLDRPEPVQAGELIPAFGPVRAAAEMKLIVSEPLLQWLRV